jgi:hypothetical protein
MSDQLGTPVNVDELVRQLMSIPGSMFTAKAPEAIIEYVNNRMAPLVGDASGDPAEETLMHAVAVLTVRKPRAP